MLEKKRNRTAPVFLLGKTIHLLPNEDGELRAAEGNQPTDPVSVERYLLNAFGDASPLRPATADEIAKALAFALRYEGRRRVHDADQAMGRITADRLVRHLERSGFVLMKASPAPAPTTAPMPPSVR